MMYPGNDLFYNDFNLRTIPNFMVKAVDVHEMPKRALEAYKLARANGEAIVSSYWDYREIIVHGAIIANSKANFEVARDTLFNALTAQGGRLETTIAGNMRRYYVTLSDNTNWPDFGSGYASFGGFANVELHFNAYDPFGYDLSYTNLTMGSMLTTTKSFTETFGGTWDARPIFTLTLNGFTGAGLRTISVTNPATGLGISVNRTWFAADVLSVDTENRLVTVNGVKTSWTGAVPSWETGSGTVQVGTTFITCDITAAGEYVKRYI